MASRRMESVRVKEGRPKVPQVVGAQNRSGAPVGAPRRSLRLDSEAAFVAVVVAATRRLFVLGQVGDQALGGQEQ